MKKHFLRTAACALILSGLASCQSDDIACSDEMSQEELAKELEKRFDFSSYKTLPLTLKMSPFTHVSFYEIDPGQNSDAKPFFEALTNINGEFDMEKTFPAHLIGRTIWADTGENVIKAVVTKNGLSLTSKSRALQIDGLEGGDGLCKALATVTDLTLVPGRNNTDVLEHQMKNIDILPISEEGVEVLISAIDYGDQYWGQLYYFYYDSDRELTEQYASFPQFVERFISDKYKLLPQGTGEWEDGQWMTERMNDDENYGKSAQLKYYGVDGDEAAQDVFPKGMSIGFIHLTEDVSYMASGRGSQYIKLSTGGAYKVKDNNNENFKLEDPEWSTYKRGIPQSAAAMDIKFVLQDAEKYGAYDQLRKEDITNWVYTFEDATYGGDRDMNDFKFLAIIKGDVKHTVPYIIEGRGTFKGYYCFEDLYPDQAGGDYDLNDVIVAYEYQYNLGRVHSHLGDMTAVTAFCYNIMPVHDGATYINDFHLSYSPYDELASSGKVEVYTNHTQACLSGEVYSGSAYVVYDPATGYFNGKSEADDKFAAAILFSSENHIIGPNNVIVGGNTISSVAGINPYIYCQNTDKQVHLSKFTYVGPNSGAGGTLLDHYLTTNLAGESYRYCPFAIDIPDCDGSKFTPTPEAVPIYQAYPRFAQWVESDGKEAQDWYTDTPIVEE